MLRRLLPFLSWFHGYDLGKFRADLVAGVTVALVLIPQSMAYAQLAGLPPYYGLYAAFLPPMVAALFGSSRQLATGPVAVVSLMTAASLEPLATAGSEAYIAYAVLLAVLVGLFQLALGVLRLGVIVNFLSHPVVIGFTNAAAIIIATSQLSKIFGVSVDKAEHHYETVWRVVVAAWSFVHWPTFLLSVLAFVIMIGIKRINPRLPYVLVAVAVTTVISWAVGLEHERTIDISSIRSEEVRGLIESYSTDARDAFLMAEARNLLSPEVNRLSEQEGHQCSQCHEQPEVDLSMLREAPPAPESRDVLPKTALQLHSMAGLLDRELAHLKENASEARARLRGLKLAAVEGRDGETEFRLQAEVPDDGRADGRTWRLTVGNGPVDVTALKLVGGGAVVGVIPGGLPPIAPPVWDATVLGRLFFAAVIISLLGFMEAISIAKAMAARTGQRLDPNQELIGQGLANVLGAFGQSYAVSGSFSRSAVNIQAGAVSGMSSVITSGVVVVVLLFMTPLLYHLPQSVLAAVIMMAVVGLINFRGVAHAWRVQRSDGVVSVVAFAATLAFAPHLDKGILIGVVLSVGMFLYRKMKPAIAELSLWRDGHLHDARRLGLAQCQHIAVIRFEGPLFFANTSYLENEVLDRTRAMPGLRYLVFVANGVNELDASGEEALSLLVERLRAGGYDVFFCGFSERIVDVLHSSHLYEKIGEDHFFAAPTLAIEAIWTHAHQETKESVCPLRTVVHLEAEPEEVQTRVLLVDDEEDFVEALARRLSGRGMVVETCQSGAVAMARLGADGFDVVVLDVLMPGKDGSCVLRDIKATHPKLPVIMLTGHGSLDSAVKSVKEGAFDYLVKPCAIDELTAKIRGAQQSVI